MQYKRVLCLLLAAGLGWGVTFSLKAQPQGFDIQLTGLQFPDSVTEKQAAPLSFYIKNNGPDSISGKMFINFYISDNLSVQFDSTLKASLANGFVLPLLGAGDSVEFRNMVFIDGNIFTPSTENIVIVWPTQINGDIDTSNNHISDTVYVNPSSGIATGVINSNPLNGLSVFPNPASTSATIHCSGDGLNEIIVYDALGKIRGRIAAESLSASRTFILDLKKRGFSPGIYFLSTGTADRNRMTKLVYLP